MVVWKLDAYALRLWPTPSRLRFRSRVLPGRLRRFHHKAKSRVHPAAPSATPERCILAQHLRNRGHTSSNQQAELAAFHLSDPLPSNQRRAPDPASLSCTSNLTRSPSNPPHLLRSPSSQRPVLPAHIPQILHLRLPWSRALLHPSIRRLQPPRLQSLSQGPSRVSQSPFAAHPANGSLCCRCDRNFMGFDLLLQHLPSTRVSTDTALVSWRVCGWFMGFCCEGQGTRDVYV